MSSGFISEAEIAEQRRIRQEEWERVRMADQPLEAPEEPCDSRSLYERLQEQKIKRDAEYEEAHKLKNMIKGLDDDEVEFLDLVDRTKLEEERKKNLEVEMEMRNFKAAVASLQEKSMNEKLKQELKNPQTNSKTVSSGSSRNSQLKLLAGVVVKRSEKQKEECVRGVKRKMSATDEDKSTKKEESHIEALQTSENSNCKLSTLESVFIQTNRSSDTGSMKCIGILPGLGSYEDSSGSDCSSDSDQEPEPNRSTYDLLGREIKVADNKENS